VLHESFVTPKTLAEVDVATDAWTVLKRQEVLGGYDATAYVQRREWVRAADGVAVPLSLVHRAGVEPDGTAPVILYGYGAYEASMDPWFSIFRLSLLDRGVVFAVAHVRGGGELGRAWYDAGKLAAKPTTFTDMVACARHLHERGWCAPDRLAIQGGSAGGLTVGATLNLAPELFVAAHADVPFVDALTSMLDESLPLTVAEWEEWGDPLHDAAAYACMRSYTPYENIQPVAYPTILATTSLNDTRVLVAEPAKWVARLRAVATQDQEARPILLRTEMVAGHGGKSGRYDAWEQYAFEAAFLLTALGATELR
jgi:oligopeptidase B